MSFDTNKNYFYKRHGKIIRIYRLRKSSARVVDNQGRVNSSSSNELIYPDENITNGLRLEYTTLKKPFVESDPDVTPDASNSETTTPGETSHINLNRVLSLAVVEYLKAQFAERGGDVQTKEYFMREFYNKLSDNESNRNDIFVAIPLSPYAVR